MRALASNGTLWAWARVQANTSAISTENASRQSIHEKLTKLFIYSPKKNQAFCQVMCARWEVTLLDANILYGAHSVLDTLSLFSLFTTYSWCERERERKERERERVTLYFMPTFM